MLEPLEACNLACEGCGRIREYEAVIDRTVSLEKCLSAVEESGAPIVSIAGGEPTLHPQIHDIVNGITARKKFVYMCTNALLMDRVMRNIPPSKYFCFVVHLDGMEEAHDKSVYRKGVFKMAIRGIETALAKGYRGHDQHDSLQRVRRGRPDRDVHAGNQDGCEGAMVSPGYQFKFVPTQELFVSRQAARKIFKNVLDPRRKIRFYNNPLYLDFLRGDRDYSCTAWSNPTYTVMGWREPCYLLGDRHTQDVNDLFKDEVWDRYGVGTDPRCANCMMHCGFESASVFSALSSPRDAIRMIREGAVQNSGVGA